MSLSINNCCHLHRRIATGSTASGRILALGQGDKHLLAQSVEWARKEKLHSGRSRKPGPDLISSASADQAYAGLRGIATASLPPHFLPPTIWTTQLNHVAGTQRSRFRSSGQVVSSSHDSVVQSSSLVASARPGPSPICTLYHGLDRAIANPGP